MTLALSSSAPLALVSQWTHTAVLSVLGFAVLAGVVAMGAAFVTRWATGRALSTGAAIVAGSAVPASVLLVQAVVRDAFVEPAPLVGYASSSYLLGVFAGTLLATAGGRSVGDYLACAVFDVRRVEGDRVAAGLVRSAGVAVSLTLPDTIGDLEGYRPVAEGTKRRLAGRRLIVPRGLSESGLERRLRDRLEVDFDVDRTVLEVGPHGSIDSLAVGRLHSGRSPTVPPGMEAVAIDSDVPAAASDGDPLEVRDEDGRLVAMGVLCGVDGPTATIIVEADVTADLEDEHRYRLAIRAAAPDDGRELVRRIQRAPETISTRTVETGDDLEGEFVEWVPGTVLVIERDGDVHPFPAGREPIRVGDRIHTFGMPEELAAL
ncbi:hypothetical protein ACFQO4_06010 [Saliphagus sp. GCM10025334]